MVMGSLRNQRSQSATSRMLVYLVVDVSGSMQGPPLQAVNEGIELLTKALLDRPEASQMIHICVVTFDSYANMLVPLTPITSFIPPQLQAGGSTNMAAALEMVNRLIDHDFKPTIAGQVKGDYKPMIFLLTDGEPDDLNAAEAAANVIRTRPTGYGVGTYFALGCGMGANSENLPRLANQWGLMHNMSRENIKEFFKWVGATLIGASKLAAGMSGDMETPDVGKNSQGEDPFKIFGS